MRSLGRRLRLGVGAVQLMPRSASTGELGRHQSSDPDEVVRSGDQVASQLGPRQAAKVCSTEATHGLHPAKDLLYSLAEALAQAVAGVACRSTIDRTPPPSRVLRHVGRHAALAQLGHTLAGVIVLVPSRYCQVGSQGSLARCPSPSPLPRCTAATASHRRSSATRSGYTCAFHSACGMWRSSCQNEAWR